MIKKQRPQLAAQLGQRTQASLAQPGQIARVEGRLQGDEGGAGQAGLAVAGGAEQAGEAPLAACAFYEGPGSADGGISGSPVSPGVAEGLVRVVFDPQTTHLLPGEILVCPGTDPAWTPLFLSAGGLITEVGGMMTHGSVVAREYGIPAVVGVHQATTRPHTGQRIRLDGMAGTIEVLDEAPPIPASEVVDGGAGAR